MQGQPSTVRTTAQTSPLVLSAKNWARAWQVEPRAVIRRPCGAAERPGAFVSLGFFIYRAGKAVQSSPRALLAHSPVFSPNPASSLGSATEQMVKASLEAHSLFLSLSSLSLEIILYRETFTVVSNNSTPAFHCEGSWLCAGPETQFPASPHGLFFNI